jgi:glucokinase
VILAADIGGTNARLALFERGSRTPAAVETYRTDAWRSGEELLRAFLTRRSARVSAACVAVAGPVRDGRSQAMNLQWRVDERRLAAALGIPAVAVVNDLEANARGIAVLEPEDLAVVNAGDPDPTGNRAVVSAGTGLGEAGLVWDGGAHRAVAGEGGHADFAPRSELEVALYRHLAAQFGHVSYERVLSGNGLVNVYGFLRGPGRAPLPSPAEISADAERDPNGLGARALGVFAAVYGARAANVALSFMATGGVYLGGGIAPRLVDRLRGGAFMAAFTAKGRLSSLLAAVPVYVVLNDRAALLGAAEIASESGVAGMRHALAA